MTSHSDPDLLTVLAGFTFRWGTMGETYGETRGAMLRLMVTSDSVEALLEVRKRLYDHPRLSTKHQNMVVGERDQYSVEIDCSAIEPCPVSQRAAYATELLTTLLGKAPGT